jgi:hypothetical protein
LRRRWWSVEMAHLAETAFCTGGFSLRLTLAVCANGAASAKWASSGHYSSSSGVCSARCILQALLPVAQSWGCCIPTAPRWTHPLPSPIAPPRPLSLWSRPPPSGALSSVLAVDSDGS